MSNSEPKKGLRWVKASERLPEKIKNYHVKRFQFNKEGESVYNDTAVFQTITKKFYDTYRTNYGEPIEAKVSEWLDESNEVPCRDAISDTDILSAGDKYNKNGKQKHKGVTSFDFLAGARWMEKQKPTVPCRDGEQIVYVPIEKENVPDGWDGLGYLYAGNHSWLKPVKLSELQSLPPYKEIGENWVVDINQRKVYPLSECDEIMLEQFPTRYFKIKIPVPPYKEEDAVNERLKDAADIYDFVPNHLYKEEVDKDGVAQEALWQEVKDILKESWVADSFINKLKAKFKISPLTTTDGEQKIKKT